MLIEILQFSSCMLLGLLVGSLLTEAFILVPYWRRMDPAEFLSQHGTVGPKLFQYFAPLTVSGTALPVAAVVVPFVLGLQPDQYSLITALLVLIMLAIYFTYFRGANESFKSGSVGVHGLSAELKNWARWHWVRVVLGLIAFFTSLLVIS